MYRHVVLFVTCNKVPSKHYTSPTTYEEAIAKQLKLHLYLTHKVSFNALSLSADDHHHTLLIVVNTTLTRACVAGLQQHCTMHNIRRACDRHCSAAYF
jgi:hypothetical protein